MTSNDYGFELLAPDPVPLEEALEAGLLDPNNLLQDIPASLNAAEMAKRQFREIARVAGLTFQGFPWKGCSLYGCLSYRWKSGLGNWLFARVVIFDVSVG
jgi:ATP-dependent Lhr-like helicase